MKNTNLRILVFSILAPVALASAFLLLRKTPSITNALLQDQKTLADWRSLEFHPIEATSSFRAKVQTIALVTNSPISPTQHEALFAQLYDTFIGLNNGAYDVYRNFRTPTPARLDPELFSPTNRQMLATGALPFLREGESVPEDFEEYVKLMTSRMNGGRGLSNFWVAVNLSNAWVRIDEYKSMPPDILSEAAKGERVGLHRPRQFFEALRRPTDILRDDSKLVTATVSMVVKHFEPDPAFRVYVSYYWDGKYERWVPGAFANAYSQKRKWSFIW